MSFLIHSFFSGGVQDKCSRIHVYCDVTPSAPTLHQLLRTISLFGRWSTRGSDRGIAHFFTTTRNTIEGAGEKREQTNNMLGLTQVQKGSYITLCMCRLTLAWVSSENSTTLLECQLILTRLPSLPGPHLIQLVSLLRCRLVTRVTLRQLPTYQSFCLTLWLAFPYPFPVMSRSQIQNPLSGFAPKQTRESSAWRTSYIVL